MIDETRPPRFTDPAPPPDSAADLRAWIHTHLRLPAAQESELLRAIDGVLARQHRLWTESKTQAIHALCEGFAEKVDRLQSDLLAKDETISSVTRYFEALISDLTAKTHRDPKTKLMNFDWFMERLASFLALEQRTRWCGVGVVDITAFKHYNDTLGHPVGDRIIKRVARILSEQLRGEDLLAAETEPDDPLARGLHARFGGDEFCFLIPDLPGAREALLIAERFKRSVERHTWGVEDERLTHDPVSVDVGVVCMFLGPVAERRPVSKELAADLIQWADRLMYRGKSERARGVRSACVAVKNGALVAFDPERDSTRPGVLGSREPARGAGR